jgi:peptidoglycan-associated lipoprotein
MTPHSEVYAQKKSRQLKKADQALILEQYSDAIKFYKKAYKKTKNRAVKVEIIFKQAESYRMLGKIKQAVNYYKRAIKAKYPDVVVYLRYADMLRMSGDFDEAVAQYTKYIQLNPTDVRGEMGLKSCDFSLKWKDIPTRYKVEIMSVVNTRFSDFSPAFGNEDYSELYFTSTREGGVTDKIDARTGESFSDVWFTKLNKKGVWSRPVVMTEPINTEGNEGSVYVNKRGTTMYLTQCKVEKKKDLGCGIYVSQRKGKIWGGTQLLQVKVDSATTIGHPALSEDESVLIFSSDLSGGYGGKDLWITVKEKRNRWSDPINLGPLVNTPGDEMFPFLSVDGIIYFASNGHVGMGGFDIYKTSKDEYGAYTLPVNLKVPVNSTGDDFGMIVEKNGERGYFTSNRSGGKGGDDIYQFELPALKLSVQGIVTDSKTGSIMTGTKVQLIGSNGTANEFLTDNTGKYVFKLEPLVSYEIIANKTGYLTKIARENTEGIEFSTDFIVDLNVDPIKKEIILPLIKYDFNKFDLRSESLIDLDRLSEGLLDNPNVVIELKSHTDFVGSNTQNNKLSQQRADACISYLVTKGVDAGRLISKGMGENEPFVIYEEDGRFKVGDVLTESYIKEIIFKKNKEIANQYNRRTSFKVIREDYVLPSSNMNK